MKPRPNNINVFLALILLGLIILVFIATLIYQNRNKPVDTPVNSQMKVTTQISMNIIKPKSGTTITMPSQFEARVKVDANTKDLTANLLINGKDNIPLRIRKTPSGDIFLAGDLDNLEIGGNSMAVFLYKTEGTTKVLISNALYRIQVTQ